MSIFGTPAVTHLAGLNQADRANVRNAESKKDGSKEDRIRRAQDEVDVQTAQSADAVKNLKSSRDEETAEERQEKGQSGAKENERKDAQHPHIDVQG